MTKVATETMAFVERHAIVFSAKDVDAILSGYSEDAVVFTNLVDKPVVGHHEIRQFLEKLFSSHPRFGEATVNPIRKDAIGEYAYLLFENSDISGTESYVVREGKIVCESSTITKK